MGSRLEWPLVCFAAFILSFTVPPWPVALVVFTYTVVFGVVVGNVSLVAFIKAFGPLAGFIGISVLPLWMALDFEKPGPWIHLQNAGLDQGLTTALRALSTSGTITMGLLCLSPPIRIGLIQNAPLPGPLAETLGITYRWCHVCARLIKQQRVALSTRLGFRSLRTTLRDLGSIAAMTFIRALGRTQKTERALASRGYDGRLRWINAKVTLRSQGF